MVFYYYCRLPYFFTEKYFPTSVLAYHSFLQCRRRLRLEIRKERIIFRRCPQSKFWCPCCAPAAEKNLAPPLVQTFKNADILTNAVTRNLFKGVFFLPSLLFFSLLLPWKGRENSFHPFPFPFLSPWSGPLNPVKGVSVSVLPP